jgi:hypothetical protein
MTKNTLIIIVGALLLLLLIPFSMWWSSDERAVKRRSNHLMDVLTISADTGGVFRQAKVFSINGILAPQLEIESSTIPEANGSFEKDRIEAAFSWICRNAKESEFEITEFVEIEVEGDSAMVKARVEGFIDLSSRRPVDGLSDVILHWVKRDGEWVLTKMTWN